MSARFPFGMTPPDRAFATLIALFAAAVPGSAFAYRYMSDQGPKLPPACHLPFLVQSYSEIRPRVLRMGFRPATKDADCGLDCKAFPERQFCGADNPRCEYPFRDGTGHELLLKTDDEPPTAQRHVDGWELDCNAKPVPPKPPASVKARPLKPITPDLSRLRLPPVNHD